jgi:transposase
MSIPGIGALIATALFAAVGNAVQFKSGRDLAAWIGLVPRQYSTGGKTRLLGLTKQGNAYLRKLLVHGARSIVRTAAKHPDPLRIFVVRLSQRAHANITVCAAANKISRIAWALLRHEEDYLANTRTSI